MYRSRGDEHCIFNFVGCIIVLIITYVYTILVIFIIFYLWDVFSPLFVSMFLPIYIYADNSRLRLRSDSCCFMEDCVVGMFSLLCFCFVFSSDLCQLLILFRVLLLYCNIGLRIPCYVL